MDVVFISTKMAKSQFKMYLSDELVDRLKLVAEKTGRSSGQEVAEEVLSRYLSVWSALEIEFRKASLDQLHDVIVKKGEHTLNIQAKSPAKEKLNFGKKPRKKKSKDSQLEAELDAIIDNEEKKE
ncbi:MAG TPA: hypothetical protein VIL74_20795 [Pyrinomonadaceae bacterium]|jgi:predicted transcriptional regulator